MPVIVSKVADIHPQCNTTLLQICTLINVYKLNEILIMSNADIFIAFPVAKLGVGVAIIILKTAGAEGFHQ